VRFHKEYPVAGDVRELKKMGVDYTRVSLSLAVPDRDRRHALLREAQDQDWLAQQLRFELQRRFPGPRRGSGGRPRRPLESYGPEITLRELERVTRRWLDFHEQAWSQVGGSQSRRMISKWPGDRRDQLRQLLEGTAAELAELGRHSGEVRKALQGLLKHLGGDGR
jgi:hypothetical protein